MMVVLREICRMRELGVGMEAMKLGSYGGGLKLGTKM